MTNPILALLLLLSSTVASAGEPVSLSSLLKEMVNRETLARFPQPSYQCKQFSSYSRVSDDPDDPSTWFANQDRSYFIRTEENQGREEHVMMDADGPGAIVRFWATWHGPRGSKFSNGTLRVYLDGDEKPAIEGPIAEVIDQGKLAGPPLSQSVSPKTPYAQRGHNLYLPIPYAKHCKVTYSTDAPIEDGAPQGEALYYQINYRTYQSDVEVESFSMERLKAAKSVLDEVQTELATDARHESEDWETKNWEGKLAPGESTVAIEAEGPGAIRKLRLKLNAEKLPQALRSTILKIEFDGGRTVWAPVGDFFGIGYKIRPYTSWYTAVSGNRELACWWVMPFEGSAKVSLENVGGQPVEIELCEASLGDWKWDDRSLLFHATWHQKTDVETRSNKAAPQEGAFDVNYVTVEGKGVYAGDTLTLFNGASRWWGEGDEKIYVDGESFPSHFGTGTEDYYGYAWCRPESFDAPFHAQPEGGGNLTGGFSVNSRYRALDAIPFENSLQFDMELWHWAKTKMNFAPTAFFYARPQATTNVEPQPQQARHKVLLRRPPEDKRVFRAKGAIEGERRKVVQITGGSTEAQNLPAFGWSNNRQLWWIGAKPGDKLTVQFPARKARNYRVAANLTKAKDYGIVKIYVNGEPAAKETYDRYNPTVEHDKINLGVFKLKKGPNKLTFEITGANPAALKEYMVGLDYLKLTPIKNPKKAKSVK